MTRMISGAVVLVTGAGSGIGRASALAFAERGAHVVAVDVSGPAAEQVARDITRAGGVATAAPCDVSDQDAVADLFARTDRDLGLDILHSNAGVLGGPRFPDPASQYWSRAIEINLVGTMLCIQHAVPVLARRGGGAIVSTASIAGLQPHFIDPAYAATKAAVVNLTRSLAFLKDESNITVNAVCPGLVDTPLDVHTGAALDTADRAGFLERRRPLQGQRRLQPADVAAAVVRLAEDDSLAGQCLVVVAGEEDRLA